MKKYCKKLVALLTLSLVLVTSVVPVNAKTNNVTGTTSESTKKIKSVKTGTNKISIKSFPKGYDILTWSRVKYKAPKTGTYSFKFSNLSSGKLDRGVATFAIQTLNGSSSYWWYSDIELDGLNLGSENFRLIESKELFNDLTEHYTEAYSEGYENPEQRVADKLKECEDSLSGNDTYDSMDVKLRLKKGQTVYIATRSAGEMNIGLGCDLVNNPFNYTLKIKKIK